MIRIEHLNIVVKDMESTLRFYRAAFPHWSVRQKGTNNWFGHQRNWLHFGDDYTYITFNDGGKGELTQREQNPLGIAHFAFEVTDVESVKATMLKAGFEAHDHGARNPFRQNCYFIDPNGLEIEFVAYNSNQPAERNSDNT